MLVCPGADIHVLDAQSSELLDEAVSDAATLLETYWDLADRTRHAVSLRNRENTAKFVAPEIDIGDFVLYATHKPDTKIDYVWRGPGVVQQQVSPLVYLVQPAGVPHAKPFHAHVCRLRRFATQALQLTEQLRVDLARDHPDNIVSKVVQHQHTNGVLWFRCRWLGFTAEADT